MDNNSNGGGGGKRKPGVRCFSKEARLLLFLRCDLCLVCSLCYALSRNSRNVARVLRDERRASERKSAQLYTARGTLG